MNTTIKCAVCSKVFENQKGHNIHFGRMHKDKVIVPTKRPIKSKPKLKPIVEVEETPKPNTKPAK